VEPLLDLLRSVRREHEIELPADLARLVTEQSVKIDDDPERAKRRLFESLTAVLLAQESDRPIIIEDLHWCDDISLEFLTQFARAISSRPIVLLLTYRNDDVLSQPCDLSSIGMGMQTKAVLIGLLLQNIHNHAGEISCLKGLQGLQGYPA